MAISTKKKEEAFSILKAYSGNNPYILGLKRDVFVKNNQEFFNDFAIEYIRLNWDYTPREINKIIKIADWYGEKKQIDWNLEFIPKVIKITYLIGETDTTYHCYGQYRKSIQPVSMFIPKKAVLTNFLVEDFRNIQIDFSRYDKLSTSKDPNRKLQEHQKEAVQFLVSRKKCVLADDMGLGKTASLSVGSIEGNFDAILIICPASLKLDWKRELMWYIPEREISIIEGYNGKNKSELEAYLGYTVGKSGKTVGELNEEARNAGKWRETRYIIINYDIIDEFYEIPASRSKENIEKAYNNSPILQFLSNKKSLLICDEAHKLSNMKSGRFKIIKDIVKRADLSGLYLATGTPITNDPMNFYNLLSLLNDPITDDWSYYMKRYCGAIEICKDKKERDYWTSIFLKKKNKTEWKFLTDDEKLELRDFIKNHCKMITIQKDPTNLDELKERVSHLYLRRVKEDLDSLTVKKNVHEIFYNFDMQQWIEYSRLWEEYEQEKLSENSNKDLNKQLIEGAVYRKYCSIQMIPNTIKMTEKKIQEGHKVVIICCYDEELYTLQEHFNNSCVIYNGKMSLKEKENAKYEFINNPNKTVFIGNILACGVGLTLVVSDVLIFNQFDYTSANCKQAEDRIFRIGQKKDVDVYYQMFIGTQYEKMWKTVLKKELLFNEVIKKEDEK